MHHATAQPNIHGRGNYKDQARRLRAGLLADGHRLSHGEALELVARTHGFRDWNTLAATGGGPVGVSALPVGSAVRGHYLGQPFTGRLVAIQSLAGGRHYRVTIQFDEPVDVVSFDSFSALRRRVSATVGEEGRSREKTSDGRAHLQLDL